MKQAFRQHNVDFQRVPAHQHRRNAAERAIQTWKNHFISGLASTDLSFPLHAWDRLLPQCDITLNLLRSSRRQPKLSAYACLFGSFDFNRTPLAVPGTKVIIHDNPSQRATFAPHGTVGYYIGPSLEHYRCYKIFIPTTHSTRDCMTVEWSPHTIPFPRFSQTAEDVLSVLQSPNNYVYPSLQYGDNIYNDYREIASILRRATTSTPVAPTSSPTPNPPPLPPNPVPTSPNNDIGPVCIRGATRSISSPFIHPTMPPLPPPPPTPPSLRRPLLPPTPPLDDLYPIPSTPVPRVMPSPPLHIPTASPPKATPFLAPPPRVVFPKVPPVHPAPPPASRRYPTRIRKPTSRYGFACAAIADQDFKIKYKKHIALMATDLLSPVEKTTKLPTLAKLLKGPDKDIWMRGTANEFGRLLPHGIGKSRPPQDKIESTGTIFPIHKSMIPHGRTATYANFIPAIRPNKKETYRVRICAGGNLLDYPGDPSSPAVSLTNAKLHINSTISDAKKGARYLVSW